MIDYIRTIDYVRRATSKPFSGRNTMNITVAHSIRDVAKELCSAVYCALGDEAELQDTAVGAYLDFEPRRTIRCYLSGSLPIWWAQQYLYYARAIPEAYGYSTHSTDRGTVLVTTEVGEHICEFIYPEKGEGRA